MGPPQLLSEGSALEWTVNGWMPRGLVMDVTGLEQDTCIVLPCGELLVSIFCFPMTPCL